MHAMHAIMLVQLRFEHADCFHKRTFPKLIKPVNKMVLPREHVNTYTL